MDHPKISFIQYQAWANTCHKLERRTRAREREREEWEKRDFGIVTIPRGDVSNEGGEALIYTWEPRVTALGCSPSVNLIASLSISRRGAHFLGF